MHHYDEDGLLDIFRQYGDHLYSKGDYSGAIENYVKTIGHVEPSYVIRKFLEAHKIHHLTEYLQVRKCFHFFRICFRSFLGLYLGLA